MSSNGGLRDARHLRNPIVACLWLSLMRFQHSIAIAPGAAPMRRLAGDPASLICEVCITSLPPEAGHARTKPIADRRSEHCPRQVATACAMCNPAMSHIGQAVADVLSAVTVIAASPQVPCELRRHSTRPCIAADLTNERLSKRLRAPQNRRLEEQPTPSVILDPLQACPEGYRLSSFQRGAAHVTCPPAAARPALRCRRRPGVRIASTSPASGAH
jgi:hypothetical protein